jgi:tetraacyldisaccharide 4'-kinase
MNPGVTVITGADRVAGIRQAMAAGADVVVMDDAYQHRRAGRDLDIVLVSAEHWTGDARLLPAGPFREPIRNLRRADIIVVTRKSASEREARDVAKSIVELDDDRREIVVAALEPTELVAVKSDERKSIESLAGASVLAIAGIGDPESFYSQLTQLGATVTKRSFQDHHDYTADDVVQLVADGVGHKYAVTTQKDAVKLARVWPANGPVLWYLSQAVRLTEEGPLVAAALAKLFKRATLIAG